MVSRVWFVITRFVKYERLLYSCKMVSCGKNRQSFVLIQRWLDAISLALFFRIDQFFPSEAGNTITSLFSWMIITWLMILILHDSIFPCTYLYLVTICRFVLACSALLLGFYEVFNDFVIVFPAEIFPGIPFVWINDLFFFYWSSYFHVTTFEWPSSCSVLNCLGDWEQLRSAMNDFLSSQLNHILIKAISGITVEVPMPYLLMLFNSWSVKELCLIP